jgi:hypothetical protein
MDNRASKDVLMSVTRSAVLDWLSVRHVSRTLTREISEGIVRLAGLSVLGMAFLSIYAQTRRQTIGGDVVSSELPQVSTEGLQSPRNDHKRITSLALLDGKDANHFHELGLESGRFGHGHAVPQIEKFIKNSWLEKRSPRIFLSNETFHRPQGDKRRITTLCEGGFRVRC